ncbi:hypothetical protein JCM10908_001038 [Rhodotorula pacifica]|uniref:NSE2 family E3 SUMO-protein ligase n=1 Tax=Rhodotorula pacifica TaxID=1495444 RepID=UPI003178E795
MPPSNRRNKRAVDSEEDDHSAASDDDQQQQQHSAATDKLLTKVDPEYLNTPIDVRQGDAKLRAIFGNLKSFEANLRDAELVLQDVAAEMAEMLGEEHREEDYNEDTVFERLQSHAVMTDLEADYLKTLERQAEIALRAESLKDMRQRLTQGHQMTDVWKVYEKNLAEPMEKHKAKTARQRYEKDKRYLGYRDLIWENLTGGQAVPSVKRFLPREEADAPSDDEDIEFGAQTSNFQCPLEMTVLVDPYKSTICPHAFSGRAIKELLQQEQGRTRCPVPGCSKTLTMAVLERDEQLARRVAAHVKRQKEGRTQTGTQARTYTAMNLSESEDEEDGDEEEDEEAKAAKKVKLEVKKEKAK